MINDFGGGGQTSLFNPVTLDSSVLTSWYAVRSGTAAPIISPSGSSSAASAQKILPPWDSRRPQVADPAKLKDTLTRTDFIVTKGRYFDQPDVPADHKKLFSLYLALGTLESLARHAADSATPAGQLKSLDARLQDGLSEITTYLSETKFDELTLLRGEKRSFVDATFAVPRSSSTVLGTVAHTGAFDDPMTSINGDEVFTISVLKANATTDVVIDLSQMGATPRTIDNVITFINDTLDASGMVTRFKREKLGDDRFGFKIEGVSTEQLTFSAAAAQPALYVSGVSGSGMTATGQVLKLNDLSNSDPSIAFSRRIETADGTVSAAASALDSQGHLYVIGTTTGDLGGQVVQGDQDVFLRKYDSNGNLLWTRLLGAANTANGFALAVDSGGDVVVAGEVNGNLTSAAIGGGKDSFVTKFNADGEELFTRQLAPRADDAATALTIGSDGAIYVGGYAKGTVASGITYGGSADAYVTKLNANGSLVYNRQFGGSGDERVRALAIANDGALLVASVEDGNALLRKFNAANGTDPASWTMDLGALNGGSIGGIAVDGSAIYLAGKTGNASLDAGGLSAIVTAHSGGQDGFLTRIDDGGASASANFTTYVGTGASDGLTGVVASGGTVYVIGETRGTLPGETKSGAVNGFAGKLDNTGAVDWLFQYGGHGGVSSGASIALDPSGSSVLDALGLPRGTLDTTPSKLVIANTSVRTGASFQIAVNGKPARRIRIEADDSLRSLALKVNSVLLLYGKATVRRTADGDKLKIEAKEGTTIEFLAGPEGFDALAGLGLQPGKIINEGAIEADDEDENAAPKSKVFGLGFDQRIDLRTKKSAEATLAEIGRALAQVRKAYRALTLDPLLAQLAANNKNYGPAPAHMRAQIANYQAGLVRLQAGAPLIFA